MKSFWIQSLTLMLLPIFLIIGSVHVLATDEYLSFEYRKADFPGDPFGWSLEERFAYAKANFQYVRDALPVEKLQEQRFQGRPLYNPREIKHMQDVQRVYLAAHWAWAASAIGLAVLGLIALSKQPYRSAIAQALRSGGIFTASLVASVGLLAFFAWQLWFVIFHQVFFAPGSWTFSYSDTLIRLFPEKFWFDAALTLTGISFIGSLFFFAIGKILGREYFTGKALEGYTA